MKVREAIALWDNAGHPPSGWQLDSAEELCRILGLDPDGEVPPTPENVECQTCGDKPWFKKIWWHPDHPDNLITLPDERFDVVPSKCPECDALVEEAIQWRDWQSLDMGVYCDKHTPCPECHGRGDDPCGQPPHPPCGECDGTGRTPENVEET